MFTSNYYPAGAEYDPAAPWNRSEPSVADVDVEYSCLMRRTATVSTTNYVPGPVEFDSDGYPCGRDDDFSETDWDAEFKRTYRTPRELIDLLADTARKMLSDPEKVNRDASFWRDVLADCHGWTTEDEMTEMC
ncbi:MAG: hypothetical protein IJ626_01275 [Muribaculaceae bacterium]|nr:hypothetical protein [Muribaculaceae bacterium]